jgi:hypothetical protein
VSIIQQEVSKIEGQLQEVVALVKLMKASEPESSILMIAGCVLGCGEVGANIFSGARMLLGEADSAVIIEDDIGAEVAEFSEEGSEIAGIDGSAVLTDQRLAIFNNAHQPIAEIGADRAAFAGEGGAG